MPNYGFTVNADGNVNEIMAKMQAAVSSFGGTVSQTTSKVKNEFSQMSGSVGSSLGGVVSSLKGVFAGLAILQGVKSFLQMGVEAEQTAMSFEVFLGSAEKAKDMVGQLKKMGASTPLETTDLNNAAKVLLNFNVSANEVMGDLKMLGDTASGNAQKFESMTRAFAKTSAAGKLTGEDLNMMIDAGFNPLLEMYRTTGISVEELRKRMEKGQISVAMVKNAFKTATSEGGNFYQMMDKQSQTLGGMWSTFMDGLKEPLYALFDVLAPILKDILTGTTKAIEALKELFSSSSAGATALRAILVTVIAALAVYYTYQAIIASWTAIVTAATWAWNAAMAANPLTWIILLIVALVAAVALLWDKFEGFRAVIGGVFGFFKQQITTVMHAFTNFAQIIDDIFHGRFAKAFQNGKKLINDFKNDVTTGMVDAIKKGADAAAKSEFKFGDLLKVGTGQGGPSKDFGSGTGKGGGVTQNAINTSQLAGAKGGLGEAKVINIKIDTMQKIVTTDNKQLRQRGQDAVEVMLRTVNNIAYSSSQTQ